MKAGKNVFLVLGGGIIAAALLLSSGMVSAHGFGFGLRGGDIADVPLEKLEKHAEILGIDAEDLAASLENGDSFKDIIAEAGITKEDLHAARLDHMLERKTDWLSKLVEDGKLTQEEADEKIEALESGEWFGLKKGHGFKEGFGDGEEHEDGDWRGKGYHFGKHGGHGFGK